MSYTPQTWVDGAAGNTPLNATRLNYIEAGIQGAYGITGTGGPPAASTAYKGVWYFDTAATDWYFCDGTAWHEILGSVVSSFNTRTGPVMPAAGDYTAAMVTNAADKSSAAAQVFAGDLDTAGNLAANGGSVFLQATQANRIVYSAPDLYFVYTGTLHFDASGSLVASIDQAGSLTVAGTITASGANGFSAPTFGIFGGGGNQFLARPAGQASTAGQLYGTNNGQWQTFSAAGAARNTLDDGSGNMAVAGQLSAGSTVISTDGFFLGTSAGMEFAPSVASGATGSILWRANGYNTNAHGAELTASGVLRTYNGSAAVQNVLDDGSGNLVAAGTLTAKGPGTSSILISNSAANGVVQVVGGNGGLFLYPSGSGAVHASNSSASIDNVLNDGSGNMVVAGGLTVGGGAYWGGSAGEEPSTSGTIGAGIRYSICMAGGITRTLNTANARQVVTIRNNAGSGNVTVAASSGALNGTSTLTPGQFATYTNDGVNWFQVG